MEASAETLAAGTPLGPGDPTSLGRYTMLRRLGQGGMGTVYLARGPGDRLVAVKVIRADYARMDEFRVRFRRETAHARRVARFCTAEVLDADPDGEKPYLVTEFVEGATLSRVVATSGPLSAANLERLAVGVAAALTAIHGAGIVHRDLKPANVMLSPFGPRVIDFGIARASDAAIGLSDIRVGTPAFMAPEQVLGEQLTGAVDIFAWGAVVAYAGTGHYPFGSSGDTLFYRVVQEPPDLTGLDGFLLPIVERAMSKNPSARPTATELLFSLLGNTETAAPDDDAETAVTHALTGWVTPRGGTDPSSGASLPPPRESDSNVEPETMTTSLGPADVLPLPGADPTPPGSTEQPGPGTADAPAADAPPTAATAMASGAGEAAAPPAADALAKAAAEEQPADAPQTAATSRAPQADQAPAPQTAATSRVPQADRAPAPETAATSMAPPGDDRSQDSGPEGLGAAARTGPPGMVGSTARAEPRNVPPGPATEQVGASPLPRTVPEPDAPDPYAATGLAVGSTGRRTDPQHFERAGDSHPGEREMPTGPPVRPVEPALSSTGGEPGGAGRSRRTPLLVLVAVLVVIGAVVAGITLAGGSGKKNNTASTSSASAAPKAGAVAVTETSTKVSLTIPRAGTPLPDDAMIVARRVDNNDFLIRLNADGTGAQRLTSGNVHQDLPAISPDRRTVGYFIYDDHSLWLMGVDGSGNTPMLTGPAKKLTPSIDTRVSWSPDGRSVALAASGPAGAGLYTVELATGSFRKLPTQPRVGDPAWSPKGHVIAYWASAKDDGGPLFTIEADGSGKPKVLTSGKDGFDADPAWAPNGQHIAFRRVGPSTAGKDVFSMRSDGTHQTDFSPGATGDDQDPSWSPDDRSIVFSSERTGTRLLYVMNGDGTDPHEIPNQQDAATTPSWSGR